MCGDDSRGGGAPLLLLDLDGTLIATRQLYVEALARCLAPHVGRHLSDAEIMGLHPRSEVRFIAEVTGLPDVGSVLERFYAEYEALHESHFRGIYEGVPASLSEVRASGVRVGLVTGKSRRAWQITSRYVELGPLEVLVLDDDVAEGKPHPEGLLKAARRARSRPLAYVGDSLTDVEAARAAGIPAVGVLWSKREVERSEFSREVLSRGGSVVATPAELPRFVQEIRASRTG